MDVLANVLLHPALVDFDWFSFCVGFIVLGTLFELVLDARQYRRYSSQVKPAELSGIVDDDRFIRAQAYGADRMRFGFVHTVFDVMHTLAILYYGGLPFLWYRSGLLLPHLQDYIAPGEIAQSLVFVCYYYVYSQAVNLPFSLWSTFVVEERHGFNKQTVGLFFTDLLKSAVLGAVFGLPLLAALIALIRWGGEWFFIHVWFFSLFVTFFFMTVYPIFIAPCFNTFTPLPDGELRTKIEELATRLSFPLRKLFVVDGSMRSAHSNAYMYGMGKNKRVVLYDTLLKQTHTDGIIAIMAHEFGHWKLSHTIKNLVLSQSHLLMFLYLFSLLIHSPSLYSQFGFHSQPVLIGLSIFSMIYGPIESLFALLMNYVSRRFEYQADEFSTRLGYDIGPPLITLHVENLSTMDPDPWYSAWHYSHPTLVERLRHIAAVKAAVTRKTK